jgi:hypothetical protein
MRHWIYTLMRTNTSARPSFPRLPRSSIKQETPRRSSTSGLERYGEEAHQLLAKEHLAPQLLYCGRVGIHDNDPTFGELRMVVMEYVDGETLH